MSRRCRHSLTGAQTYTPATRTAPLLFIKLPHLAIRYTVVRYCFNPDMFVSHRGTCLAVSCSIHGTCLRCLENLTTFPIVSLPPGPKMPFFHKLSASGVGDAWDALPQCPFIGTALPKGSLYSVLAIQRLPCLVTSLQDTDCMLALAWVSIYSMAESVLWPTHTDCLGLCFMLL